MRSLIYVVPVWLGLQAWLGLGFGGSGLSQAKARPWAIWALGQAKAQSSSWGWMSKWQAAFLSSKIYLFQTKNIYIILHHTSPPLYWVICSWYDISHCRPSPSTITSFMKDPNTNTSNKLWGAKQGWHNHHKSQNRNISSKITKIHNFQHITYAAYI